MENTIKKPIQLVIKETRDNIVNTINVSRLPYGIIEYIIKDLYEDVKNASATEYRTVMQQYNNKLEELEKTVESEEESDLTKITQLNE